ncbi:Gfo/Idh/MocA family oxidoreductase [Candidatus Pelagibacter sp.]|nr:Gfo/Idh/MocA family oxidoreductase [Candidatus Pelagibacter sp.]
MKKYKVLILGYSNLAKNRLINTFIKNKIKFAIASCSSKKKIKSSYDQFNSYDEGLKKSLADIVYVSLPNSLHYKWAKKALECGYHVIVDKPICENLTKTKSLINVAKKNNKLLSEAIFFNYHKQIPMALKMSGGIKNIKIVEANFVIPKLKKTNFRNSKKLKGGVLMDMGCYAASIASLFCSKKILSKKIITKKNSKALDTSLNFIFDFSKQVYFGKFKFGGEYQNELILSTDKKTIKLNRVFSPPIDKNLEIKIKKNNQLKTFIVKKDNSFNNYFSEVIKSISNKKYDFYYDRMIKISKFINLLKT